MSPQSRWGRVKVLYIVRSADMTENEDKDFTNISRPLL